MHSIGKFAELTGLSIKSLRSLDRRGVLRPAVVDARSGYRYYHPSQVPRAEWIVLLKDCGLNPEETACCLSFVEGDVPAAEESPLEILKRYESEYKGRLKRIGQAKRKLGNLAPSQGTSPARADAIVQVRYAPAIGLCISRRFGDYASIDPMIQELRDFLSSWNLKEAGPPMLLWGERVAMGDEPDIEVGIPYRGAGDSVPRLYLRELPAGEVASLISSRSRAALGADYERLFDWCFSNEYLIIGPIRAAFSEEEGLTELQVPVIRAAELPESAPTRTN